MWPACRMSGILITYTASGGILNPFQAIVEPVEVHVAFLNVLCLLKLVLRYCDALNAAVCKLYAIGYRGSITQVSLLHLYK